MNLSHRNQGALQLARTGRTQADIAARIGCSRTLVAYWLSGERVPVAKWRASLSRAYKIPTGDWDELIAPTKQTREKRQPALPTGAIDLGSDEEVSVRDRAKKLGRLADLMVEAAIAPSCAPAERLRIGRQAAELLKLVGNMTGEGQEISEARILRLPQWIRIQESVVRVLEAWPDALKAFVDELRRLDGG